MNANNAQRRSVLVAVGDIRHRQQATGAAPAVYKPTIRGTSHRGLHCARSVARTSQTATDSPWENTMSVFKYAVAAAVGYYVGRPNGRRQVQRLREQAVELVRGPRAKQLKERGWDIAVERTSAAIKRAQRRRANGSATALELSDTASQPSGGVAESEPTGFGGRTVAEDTEAVRLGITPPAPVGRSHGDVNSTERS
jgi:hypothetical protein